MGMYNLRTLTSDNTSDLLVADQDTSRSSCRAGRWRCENWNDRWNDHYYFRSGPISGHVTATCSLVGQGVPHAASDEARVCEIWR